MRAGQAGLGARITEMLSRLPSGLVGFLTVGLCGLAVDVTILWLLERGGMPHPLARALSLVAATFATWLLNRTFTFSASGRRKRSELGRYGLVALLAQSINYMTFIGILWVAPHLIHAFVAFIGAVTAAGFSYSGHRFFTFSKNRENANIDNATAAENLHSTQQSNAPATHHTDVGDKGEIINA